MNALRTALVSLGIVFGVVLALGIIYVIVGTLFPQILIFFTHSGCGGRECAPSR